VSRLWVWRVRLGIKDTQRRGSDARRWKAQIFWEDLPKGEAMDDRKERPYFDRCVCARTAEIDEQRRGAYMAQEIIAVWRGPQRRTVDWCVAKERGRGRAGAETP
jgi:hypothetical protein